jgi:Protein of unknown function (DUF2786)
MTNVDPKIISRITAFLKMSESPYEAEALTALKKAHQLLKEHNLSLGDLEFVNEAIVEEEYIQFKRISSWKYALFYDVCTANYCDAYQHFFDDPNASWKHVERIVSYRIIGRRENVAGTKVMIDYLIQTVERMTDLYKGTMKEKKSYRTGLADSLRKKLRDRIKKEEQEDPESTTALMKKENALVLAYKENLNLAKPKERTINIEEYNSYLKGRRDGDGISLNSQLSDQEESVAAIAEI